MTQHKKTRNFLFILFNILALALFSTHLLYLIERSFENELYSHIILVPVVSTYFIYSNRRAILSQTGYSVPSGSILIILSAVFYFTGAKFTKGIEENDFLSIMTLSALLFWTGGFVLSYGKEALKKAAFPVLFLLFMVPVPAFLMNGIIYLLQNGSAEVTNTIFTLLNIKYAREGFIFNFGGLSIEIAKECSGIRSSLSLFIISIIAGHMYLKSGWRKGALALSILPITIFKNGLRIVTLTLIGLYVDERVLYGPLHTEGGIPFFLLALVIFWGVLWFLRKNEKEALRKAS